MLGISVGSAFGREKSIAQLPSQFLGCYRTSSWGKELTACRQPTPSEMKDWVCPNGAILIDSERWTTFEDWTCDIRSIMPHGDGVVVNEICGVKESDSKQLSFGTSKP
jgi:hypothetical protein